jgi:predicted permease
MSGLTRDLRHAVRMLVRTPGLSAAAILTIALGVGLTTHTFSIVYGSVVRGIPYPGAERLVGLSQGVPADGIHQRNVPLHDYLDWREQQTSFEDIGALSTGTVNLSDDDRRPDRFLGAFTTWTALPLTGAVPVLGRVFREDEDRPDAEAVIVLGYDVWQNRYGGDPAVIGRSVRANGKLHTVIGVMPERFAFPFNSHVWLPLARDPHAVERGGGNWLEVFGRLKPGVTLDAARTELTAISARLAEAFPATNSGVVAELAPYTERYMPAQITATLWVMLAAVFGVLLIACSNVANLLLARAVTRSREMAVRTALGASRSAVMRLMLVESLVLALAGGALGLTLSHIGIGLFNATLVDIEKPFWIDIGMFPAVLLFSVAMTLLASVVSGTIPAIKASGAGIAELLKDGSRGSGVRVGRFAAALVVGEIAISFGLLIAAGFMVKSVINVSTVEMGFDTQRVLTARVGLPQLDYPEATDWLAFQDRLVERAAALPGVRGVALTSHLPMNDANMYWYGVEGVGYASDRDYPFANSATVAPGFFSTMGTRIVAGRDFTEADNADGLQVTIVNGSFARRAFGDEPALGRRIRTGRSDSESPWRTIVGVVPDLRIGGGVGGIGSDERIPEMFYIPLRQAPQRFVSIALRTAGEPMALAPDLRELVAALDPNLPIYDVDSMEGVIETNTWAFGLFGSLFGMFGGSALFMAAVGLYGVMAFSVNRRRQELGIRMALGARPRDIARLVFGKASVQVGIGLALGLALGFGLATPLRVMMFDVNVLDPTVYLSIALVLAATATLACLVPARRATRVDITEVLRP